MSQELLTLRELSKYYTSAQQVVVGLNQINLSFSRGEFVAITGESGSGKSTLAHVLGGILPYEGGELLVDGKPTSHYDSDDWERYRRDQISFISQSYGILPGATVLTNVTSALRLSGIPKERARTDAEAILRKVELWELRRRRAAKLSSGQKQRLSIARALAKPAPILIADEPTGNLDAENSAKVISLLAEAAKERLVILITHEFSEAEAYVTRHITLHDGHVTLDAPLRPARSTEAAPRPAPARARRGLGAYVTALQLRSRPVWSVMMLCFFTLTLFAVFAFAGTFVSSLDETPTRIYDASAFPNGDSRRIVVGLPTEEDFGDDPDAIAQLLRIPHVESLEEQGYFADIQYAYREDVDYQTKYLLNNEGSKVDPSWAQTSQVTTLPGKMPFAKTVPQLPEGRELLTQGRLPECFYEVVATDASLLGQTFPVYFQNPKTWNRSAYVAFDVTVVGITDLGSGLYFHRDLGRAFFLDSVVEGRLYLPFYEEMGAVEKLFDGCALGEGEPREFSVTTDGIHSTRVTTSGQTLLYRGYEPPSNGIIYEASWDYSRREIRYLDIIGTTTSTYTNVRLVLPELFESLLYPGQGNQICLTLEDYAYTDQVLEAVQGLGYMALSPYREGSVKQDSALAEQRMQTLRICVLALLAALALQVVVLRAMFSLETESYRLLSNIGLDSRSARRSLPGQILLFAVGGQVLGSLLVLGLSAAGVEMVCRIVRYLRAPSVAALSLVHLAASLAAAAWLMRSLTKQVYPSAVRRMDLDWSALEEEEVEA